MDTFLYTTSQEGGAAGVGSERLATQIGKVLGLQGHVIKTSVNLKNWIDEVQHYVTKVEVCDLNRDSLFYLFYL